MNWRAGFFYFFTRPAVLSCSAALFLNGCGGKPVPAPLSDADRLALDDYEEIRAALAADDAYATRRAATKMVVDLTPANEKAPRPPLLDAASAVANAQALDTMRQRFETLSNQVVPLVNGVQGYYVMTADLPNVVPWVQRTDEVDNPFFGKALHGVGRLRK